MKPMAGFEPVTYRLQGDCTTIVLHRHLNEASLVLLAYHFFILVVVKLYTL